MQIAAAVSSQEDSSASRQCRAVMAGDGLPSIDFEEILNQKERDEIQARSILHPAKKKPPFPAKETAA
ncbi:MAG: hypothetical protein R3F13_09400 [Prosthecobacter sp.]